MTEYEEVYHLEEEKEIKNEAEFFGLNFDKFKITTMTAVMPNASGTIKLKPLFYLLRWYLYKPKIPLTSHSSKIKLPTDVPFGQIISIRHAGETRGLERIVKKTSKNFFQNAIAIDLSVGSKCVVVKLSSDSIHICGATSEEMCVTAVNLIYKEVKRVMDFLKNYDKHKKDIHAFIESCKGEPAKREEIYANKTSNGVRIINISYKDNLINSDIKCDNKEVYDFFHHLLKDYEYHSQLVRFISLLDKTHYIGTEDYLAGSSLCTKMINFNYHLPFKIDRISLDRLIDRKYGLYSRFNNTQETAVYVELPHEKISPKGKNMHTFMVRKTGAITQTGPRRDMMRDAFITFMTALQEIKDDVEQP